MFALIVSAAIHASVLVLIAGGFAVLLRNRGAAIRHVVWTAAIAASLSLPLLGAILPVAGVRNPFSVSDFASAVWARVAGPARDADVDGGMKGSAPATTNAPAERTLFDIGEIFASAPSVTAAARMQEALLLVWLTGFALGLLRILRSSAAVIRLRHSASTVTDARVVTVWRQLRQRHAHRNVLLLEVGVYHCAWHGGDNAAHDLRPS